MNDLALNNVNFPLVNNFYAYKKYAMSIPNLSEEEEQNLLKKTQRVLKKLLIK